MGQTVHTYPRNDLVEHTTESDDCMCGPDIEYVENGGKHVLHHSLDGRELAERNPARFRRLTCCGLVVDTLEAASVLMWNVYDGQDFFWHKNCPHPRASPLPPT